MEKEIIKNIPDEFLRDRTIVFEGAFDEKNCKEFKEKLLYLLNNSPTEDITIYISSFGGSLHSFLSIYGLLKTAQCKIITIALGYCMSAGAYLLLLGDKRHAYPGTRIMLHELGWKGSYAKLHDKTSDFEESKRNQELLCNLVKEKTKIKNVEEYLKEDKYVGCNEAVIHGILTESIPATK